MRAVFVAVVVLALAACANHAPQVAGATDPVPTKTARYCDPERSTGSHIPTCHSRAELVSPEALENMTNDAAGVKRTGR
jgi:hypothetical protein